MKYKIRLLITIATAVLFFPGGWLTSEEIEPFMQMPEIGDTGLEFPGGRSSKRPKENRSYKPGEVLVQFREGTGFAHAMNVIENNAARIGKKIPAGEKMLFHLHIKGKKSVADTIDSFERNPMVEFAQPNYIYQLKVAPNDANYSLLWGLKNTGQTVESVSGTSGKDIDAETAWNTITNCGSVVVAVVDSGVNYKHEDLSANIWSNTDEPGGTGGDYDGNGYVDDTRGWDMVENDNDPMDLHMHGTHVAGTIGGSGNNAKGISGVCWSVKIMPVRVMDMYGTGTSSTITEGYYYAASNGAHIINASIGGGSYDSAAYNAINYAKAMGVLFVAAAGNGGGDGIGDNNDSTPQYPASYNLDNIVSVAAIDQNGALASFSNYGATSVDIAAPGVNILSSYLDGTLTGVGSIGYSSWTNLSGGWAKTYVGTPAAPCNYWSGAQYYLTNPSTWCSGTGSYSNYMDARAYAVYNLSAFAGYDAFLGEIPFDMNVEYDYDFFGMGFKKSGGGDPFDGTGTEHYYTGDTGGWTTELLDISSCRTTTCSIGYRLISDNSFTYSGVSVGAMNLYGYTLDNTVYGFSDGTSMATPHVSGIAALVKARNPNFTYLDLANAIKYGGIAEAGLAGKMVTGARATASGSLKYIPTTEGVSFSYP